MNNELPSTAHSLICLLGDLKIQLQNGEINNDDFSYKQKMILNKLDKIIQEKTFNGSDFLVNNEQIFLTINKVNPNDK